MSQQFITIAVIVVGIIAAAIMARTATKEGFWNGPARAWRIERSYGPDESCKPNVDFIQTPSFQSMLSPRFSNVQYGSNIRAGQMPPYEMLGVPKNPLGDAAPTETGGLLNANGELKQPIVYDRYIYANRQSRLRAQGDPIRGDLPIMPISGNWFVPSAHPNIDLQAGALNVMAGVTNETNNKLANLIHASSGETAIGGVDMSSSTIMPRFNTALSPFGDVTVTSFP
jgi:hypothetical protein